MSLGFFGFIKLVNDSEIICVGLRFADFSAGTNAIVRPRKPHAQPTNITVTIPILFVYRGKAKGRVLTDRGYVQSRSRNLLSEHCSRKRA